MKIAQIAPLYESVPPKLYGGTERIVSYLTEELVRAGHEVVLFASGDSLTAAELSPLYERALRFEGRCIDPVALHFLLMEEVLKRQDEFDIIHSHIDSIGFVLGRRTLLPVVNTLHGRLDLWDHQFIFREYSEAPLISISNAQRKPLPYANWIATVYHGLPKDLYDFNEKGGDYLLYVGRISPEKKVDSAINIALKAGIPLKIAAKVDRADREYFEAEIRPLLDNSLVEFLGEVNDKEKNMLLGSALAFLHPVDWPEPFGVAMIEAMACGTPVIARRRGSIPEVVDHGITGFIFENDDEAAYCVRNDLSGFSRRRCRQRFEIRFSAERMARDYLMAYNILIAKRAGAKTGDFAGISADLQRSYN
ncbi:MAG TPA: glycosyltransferase family 4 protein [Nitrospirae bacterium]|nr:glycogen synthase [bacterium BMS3Abin06]HDH11238.1 glycosyltransferase family 4 protein [Nitrospirota bacterium]HDZ02479.1 glycosyltransferase family 4 protein [Nitrospirota bacterium]